MGAGTSSEYMIVNKKVFEKGRLLGFGSFGEVWCIIEKDVSAKGSSDKEGKLYAMKCLAHSSMKAKRALDGVIKERKVLSKIPYSIFVVSLHFSFQVDKELRMVLDMMDGGDLRYHLQNSVKAEGKGLPLESVKYICASMIKALEVTHGCNIVHRDIKPENIMLDKNGFCKLTDYGVAFEIPPGHLCQGVSGTLPYMCYNMLLHDPYGFDADIWSLGVVVYELLTGKLPYVLKGHNKTIGMTTRSLDFDTVTRKANPNVMKLAKVINKHPIPKMPDYLDEVTQDLIGGMLELSMDDRYILPELKAHPIFHDFDWDLLAVGKMAPPLKPAKKANLGKHVMAEELAAQMAAQQGGGGGKEVKAANEYVEDWDWHREGSIEVIVGKEATKQLKKIRMTKSLGNRRGSATAL